MSFRLRAALVAGAALLVYGLTLAAAPFYDDQVFIQGNPLFDMPFGTFLSALVSRGYFLLTGERTWQPLVTLFHYFTHERAWLFRLAGILLHALNAVLVTFYARRLLKDDARALLAGLLFAFFPPSTEAVAVSAFKGHPAAFAFILAALLAWEAESVLVYVFFALGLLCKETALLIPALALLRRRLKPAQWALFGAIALAYLGIRFLYLLPVPPGGPLVPAGKASVLSFGWYLLRLLWPHPLCLESSLPSGWTYPLIAALYLGALACARNALLAWVGLGLLPFLHLVPFANYSPVADRYLYLSAAGFCLLLARLPKAALAAVLVAWGALSLQRNALYSDPEGLAEQTAACAPRNPRAQAMLGGFYADRKRDFPKALACFERAFALDPSYRTRLDEPGLSHIEGAPYILGSLKLALGDASGAEALLRKGLEEGLGHPDALKARHSAALLLMEREKAARSRRKR
ncbi:MAG TPA: hypothetical protein DCM05_11235 [Elusimicrobia bacterium]|nr:hypothetical protein [Elusimicrobiota bacterium]